jgi:hypothetical protein
MKQPPDRPPDLLILDLSRCALGAGVRRVRIGDVIVDLAGRRVTRQSGAAGAAGNLGHLGDEGAVRRPRASGLAAAAGCVRHEGVSHDR